MAETYRESVTDSGLPPPPPPPPPPPAGSPYHEVASPKHSRRSSSPDDEGPAYLLHCAGAGREYTKEPLHSAEELRARIQEGAGTGHHVFVIHGLPLDYLEVLRELLDIDPRFTDAHVGRRSYRPLTRRGDNATFAYYDYPELVACRQAMPISVKNSTRGSATTIGPDVMGEPPIHPISTDGDMAAFCRVSFWRSPEADVLFVDRPVWETPSSGLCKSRYGSASAVGYPSGDEIPSLESLFSENLEEGSGSGATVLSLLEDIAIRHWFDFFEAISLDLPVGSAETIALHRQTQSSLEQNLGSARFQEKGLYSSGLSTSEWEALLARAGRQFLLLSQLSPTVTTIQMLPPQTEKPGKASDADSSDDGDYSRSEENKRSLDRVSYLGGVLLPLSIVSGILAMGDTYGPGGDMFFVFWATGVPLVFITLLVIYADSIRKAEVWVEVTTTGSEKHDSVPTPSQLEQAVPYSATVELAPEADSYPNDALEEPVMRVSTTFPGPRDKKWRKEQLGWTGACMTAFRLYKLKKGAPPIRVGNMRR